MTQNDTDAAGDETAAARTEQLALSVVGAGAWEDHEEVGQVLLDFDQRFRRRFALTTLQGTKLLLDLPHAVRLRDGDGLVLRDGGIIRVRSRPEHLHDISAKDGAALMRIAWHLGNRHLPVQFAGGRIRIRADHVIADMVSGLGGQVADIEAAFDPEAGAYAPEGAHHHHGGDDHP